jgi:hypothetical protein
MLPIGYEVTSSIVVAAVADVKVSLEPSRYWIDDPSRSNTAIRIYPKPVLPSAVFAKEVANSRSDEHPTIPIRTVVV